MAPYTNIPLSPAELSYLQTSLSATPPIRPDGRSPTQFRPLVAEADILPSANGSARVCFSDGTEAVVGVKAEVEKSRQARWADGDVQMEGEEDINETSEGKGRNEWLEVAVDVPGLRDDDALPTFMGAMLSEALCADGSLRDRLWINSRFHWRLYVDILLLSAPLSYPLPLLSLTTHLALLNTRLPSLISQGDEDPLFNDDWEASTHLYSRQKSPTQILAKPPITLLVTTVGPNIFFDPSRDELAVAETVLAISAAHTSAQTSESSGLKVVSMRTIDPPSRLTAAGVPRDVNSASGAAATASAGEVLAAREKDEGRGVWRAPRGGVRRGVITEVVKMLVAKGGVGEEVLGGLEGVET
ncbi:hypothetical protein Q7P37_001491 [Cladosporium fusiforme]